MGVLTDDFTRLVSEIRASGGARKALINGLTRLTKNRRTSVAAMQAGFRSAHAGMARKTKADRLAFVSNLKPVVIALRQAVDDLRREIAADIAGAHRAWFGPAPAERLQMELEERKRAEDEVKVREEEEEAEEIVEEGEEETTPPTRPSRRRRRR